METRTDFPPFQIGKKYRVYQWFEGNRINFIGALTLLRIGQELWSKERRDCVMMNSNGYRSSYSVHCQDLCEPEFDDHGNKYD